MGAQILRFGPFRLDLRAGHLRRDAVAIPLRPKTWAVLCHLVENAGRLVSKDELLDRVWDNEAVSDTIAGISIAELRRALGDDARQPLYIETVYGRGFRFIGIVESEAEAASPAAMRGVSTPPAPTPPSVTLVGRADDLAHLRALLDGDGPRVVFVAGEAGIGKSTLLQACLGDLGATPQRSAVPIGRGQCPPHFGQGYPYLPIMGALEDLSRRFPETIPLLRTHAPAWWARLHHLTANDTPTPRSEPVALDDLEPQALVRFAQALGPLVLAFEDLHWADHATLDLIVALAEHPGLPRCRVLATYRPVEAIATKHPVVRARRELERHGRAAEIMLVGFDQAGVAAFLTARLAAADCPEALAIDLLARSSGNPLFLAVSVEHLISAGALERDADGLVSATARYAALSRDIPESLRELVRQRFAEHSEREQALLSGASVVGLDAEAAAIAAALGEPLPAIDAACSALARGSIFLMRSGETLWPNGVLSGRYAFRHSLLQRVLYDDLAPAVRADAHRRVAGALVDAFGPRVTDVAALLADHFDRGHMAGDATDYHLMAARSACDRHASRDGLAHYRRALELQKASGNEEREARILAELAKALPAVEGLTGADFAASFARAHSLRAGKADVLEAVVTLAGLAVATLIRGDAAAAETLARELVGLASPHDDPSLRLPAALVMGVVHYHQGDIPAALECLAIDCVDADADVTFGPIDLRMASSALRAPILWQAGRLDDAAEQATHAVRRANAGAHPLNLVLALQAETAVRSMCSHWPQALAAAQRLRAVADEQGIHEVKAMAAMTEAAAHGAAGDADAVESLVESGVDACRRHGKLLTEVYVLALGAEALIKVGWLPRALAVLEEAQAAIAAGAARFWEPELYRLRGKIHLLEGGVARRSRAAEQFAAAQRIAEQQGSKSLALRCALAWGRLRCEENRRKQGREIVAGALGAIDGGTDSGDVTAARGFLRDA